MSMFLSLHSHWKIDLMSIIKKVPVTLSEVVQSADLILEVSCLEPFTEEVTVRSGDAKEPPPPFKKKGFIFRVKAVLKNKEKVNVPQTIPVPNEEWRRSLSQYKEKHTGGLSKSYAVKQYESEVKSFKNADILFLHHFQGNFELETKGSFESLEALEKITILIASE